MDTNTNTLPPAGQIPGVGSDGLLGGSVIGEMVRLDKIIRDCEHGMLVAERLKSRGLWHAKWDVELNLLRDKLDRMIRQRDWLDGAASRYASSPNVKAETRSGDQRGSPAR